MIDINLELKLFSEFFERVYEKVLFIKFFILVLVKFK